MTTKKKKKVLKINIFGLILSLMLIAISISLIVFSQMFDIIPNNYYNLFLAFIIISNILLFILLVLKFKNKFLKVLKILAYIITIILIIIYSVGIVYLNKTRHLFENISIIKEEVTNYYIVVLDTSNYQEPSDLYEKSLAYYETTSKEVLDSIKLSLTYVPISDVTKLKDKLYNKEVDAILISDIIKNKFEDEDEDFTSNTRILKTIEITKQIEDITKRVSIKNTPFNVLISGIDTYGDISQTSRNDVNIVATVNPNTNEILLTSIPRDYYVKLHGTEGYNDKLTHASYYGINMAVTTIEDILDIDINYYVKVNFTTVVDLVNEIGGVDVYADQAINKWKDCPIKEGYNHLNGNCALKFSRERHSYIDGDRHRGRNQQEVIKAIFTKLTSGSTILTEYTNIINVLDGKFATNIDMNEVTDFIKYELNDLKDYTIINTQLDGYGSMGPTYSYPYQDLWIMIPYEDTITNAKNLINKMLNNESIK
mgnify:FL=1